MERADWAEDHGYYHWKCRDCGMSGWTDTTPDCHCRTPDTIYELEGVDILMSALAYVTHYYSILDYEVYKEAREIFLSCVRRVED